MTTPEPPEPSELPYEQVEKLFNLRVSGSGAMITIRLGGEQMTVDYDAFQILRDSILDWHNAQTLLLLNELLEHEVIYHYQRKVGEGWYKAVPVEVIQSYISKYGGK